MVSFSAETAEEEDVVYEILVERFALVVTVLVVEKETQPDKDIDEKQVGSEDLWCTKLEAKVKGCLAFLHRDIQGCLAVTVQ